MHATDRKTLETLDNTVDMLMGKYSALKQRVEVMEHRMAGYDGELNGMLTHLERIHKFVGYEDHESGKVK